jgi:hypothetical protein
MLITTKRRYIKKHVIGGAGIFGTIANLFKRLTGSTASAIASKLASVAKTDLGKKAIEAGKTVAREVGLKAIDVGKDAAIAKAKALIDGLAPKNQEITQKSKDTLAFLINKGETTGSGAGAISIQDLVKRLNTGSGLRLA